MKMSDSSHDKPSKTMSALTAITSLVTSLFPNTIDSTQIDRLVNSLIQLAPNTSAITHGIPGRTVDGFDNRQERHRRAERNRHNKIIELIRQLSEWIGLNDRHETQANILSRSARYVLFLSYVIDKLETETTDETIDMWSEEWLYPIYQRACDESMKMSESVYEEETTYWGSETSQESVHSLGANSDQFKSLIHLENN